jgi:hypothetical protein
MSMPQYITNVTSFKDAVKILRNKAILTEAEINELSPQTKYNAAMKAGDRINATAFSSDSKYTKALKQGNKFAQEIDPVLKKTVEDFGRSLGFETIIEKGTTGFQYEPIVQIRMGKDIREPQIKVVITKDTDKIEGKNNLPDEAAERRLGNLIKQIQQKELDVELKDTSVAESAGDPPISQMSRKEMIDFLGTTAEKVKDMSDEELRDAVKDKNSNLKEGSNRAFDVAKALKDKYQMDAEGVYVYLIDDMGLDNMTAQSVVDQLFGEDGEEDEMSDLINRIGQEEEEEKAIKGGFGIQDPMEENQDYFPRDPEEMAQAIADEFRDELLSLSGIERERMAISHAYEKILNSGHPKAKIIARNLAFGYADEDWPMDYISALSQKLKTPTSEIPMFKGTKDALDSLSIREGKKKKEPKKELHPNQIHPQELRMGIKVELEHTDDLDKAKKIALDHLAENPFYYTALKLSGIESPSAPKVKAPAEKKAKKKKEAVELVDKANAMQKVKMPKIVKEAKLNIDGEPNAVVKQAMTYVDGPISNPVLQKLSDRIEFQQTMDPNEALLRYDYWKELPEEAVEKLKLQFNVEVDRDDDEDTGEITVYRLTPKRKPGNLGSSLEMGASKANKMDAFKEALEKLVRETLAETFDGRDNLANITDDTK